jgi:putative transcriptional regulator
LGQEDTLQVTGSAGKLWAMTGTVDVLRAIAQDATLRRLVALNYADWGLRQLEDELTRHGWPAFRGTASSSSYPDRRSLGGCLQVGGIDPRLLEKRNRRGLTVS